jgi:hypothetical protein
MARGQPESLFGTACDTTNNAHLFQFGQKGAISGIASRPYPSGARVKKPVSGQPGIGAQFSSFNFPNNLICGITSSCRPVRIFLPWLLRTAGRPRPTLAVAAAAGFRYLR